MISSATHLVLDATRLQREIHAHGFSSVQDFADSVGLHRNTVGNYLSGKTALPGALARILDALDLAPAEVLSLSQRRRHVPGLAINDLIETLHTVVPDTALVLFGSRARVTAKRYSDYDIGVYSSGALSFPVYSRLLDLVSTWNEQSFVMSQLVDLSRAEESFLNDIAEDLQFLAGSRAAWCDLLQQAGLRLHE